MSHRITGFGGVVLVLLAAAALPTARAQCGNPREFATIRGGPTTDKLRFDVWATMNQGQEIGRFWQSSDSSAANNFDGGCPSQDPAQPYGGWWQLSRPPLRGMYGYIDGFTCIPSGCPAGDLTVLIEESGSEIWPGRAYFMALRVDPTDDPLRYWDFSRVDPGPSPGVLEMERFPTPILLNEFGFPPNFNVVLRYPDVAAAVHGVNGPDDTPLPTSEIVKSYDLYMHYGWDDPGREVENWTLLHQRPYQPGGIDQIPISLPCTSDENPIHLALGLTFHGGSGPDVVSSLVGSSRIFTGCGEQRPNPAGCTPDGGRFVAGSPLRLDKEVVGETVTLTVYTGGGCSGRDEGKYIYEGTLGDFESHVPVSCDTWPSPFQAAQGNTYYLVVPYSRQWYLDDDWVRVPSRQGSYGRNSAGEQRPAGLSWCLGTWFEDCPLGP